MSTSSRILLLFLATLSTHPLLAADVAAPKTAPASDALPVDGTALLRVWQPPVYPSAALKAKTSGMVTVRFVVDETGRVTQARALEESDQAFVESALVAVKSWEFAPAMEAGKAIASCLDTLVAYSPSVGQRKKSSTAMLPTDVTLTTVPRTAPSAKTTPAGDYPDVLLERKLPGTVKFSCIVTPDGRATATKIGGASHVDFVLPALRSLARWEFQPATQGDLTVAAPIDGFVTFDAIGNKVMEILEANGVTAPDGTPPSIACAPSFVVDPVCPIDSLLKGEGGSATVEFRVSESGTVRDVLVRDATAPEFGQALVAAMESWGFNRPVENGHSVAISLLKHAEFKAVPLDATDTSDVTTRLVLALRRGEIRGAKGLDEKLAPLYAVRPDYPMALKATGKPAGRADIEVVIDREGRVRLPRIIAASHPEFGWAAATTVTQWVFNAPRRGGEPVDVKARIPFEFVAPEN